jgi:hypothetical protein
MAHRFRFTAAGAAQAHAEDQLRAVAGAAKLKRVCLHTNLMERANDHGKRKFRTSLVVETWRPMADMALECRNVDVALGAEGAYRICSCSTDTPRG